jgi:hypothetical protein
VLLNGVREMAREAGYKAVFIEAYEEKSLPALLVPHIRSVLLELDRLGALSEHAKRALRVFKGFVAGLKVKIGDIEASLRPRSEARPAARHSSVTSAMAWSIQSVAEPLV